MICGEKESPLGRVKDLVGAFAQNPKLPKMLRQKEILDTVVQGVRDGIWVASLIRPDHTVKTFWHTDIDDQALKDAALEVFLPEAAALSEVDPILLRHSTLPDLWDGDEITRWPTLRLILRAVTW